MKQVVLLLSLSLHLCLAHAGMGLVVSSDEPSGAQAVIGIDSQTAQGVLRLVGAAPEMIAGGDSIAFGLLVGAENGSDSVRLSIFDRDSVVPRQTASFSATRVLPIDPWPPIRTSAVDNTGKRIALFEMAEQGLTVAVRSLETGDLATRFTIPQELWSTAMPALLWTADDAGLAVFDTLSGAGRIFSVDGSEATTFNLYGAERPNPGTYQVLAGRAGAVHILSNAGTLLSAAFPSRTPDPTRTRTTLWEGARKLGTASVSNNGRFIAIPHLAIGHTDAEGTHNLQIVDLSEPARLRLLVSKARFSSVAVSASGATAVVCGLDGSVAIIDARNGEVVASTKLASAAYALGYIDFSAAAESAANVANAQKPKRAAGPTWLRWAGAVLIGLVLVGFAVVGWLRRSANVRSEN